MSEVNFTITENAAKRLSYLASLPENKGKNLRVAVDGGGCSGFQYKYDFTNESQQDDHKFTQHNVTAIIDDVSMEFLSGCTLDYIENLGGAYFEIRNPKASAKCGCGNSFSI